MRKLSTLVLASAVLCFCGACAEQKGKKEDKKEDKKADKNADKKPADDKPEAENE